LDDGRLTDGQGRTVDFRNTVLIMTSNIGSARILQQTAAAREWSEIEGEVRQVMHEHFKPEFLNRIDDILVFKPLSREDLGKIVELQLARLQRNLAEREVELNVSSEARERIADEGYDPAFGARPLKRAIQRLVTDPLAMAFLEGRFDDGDSIRVEVGPEEGLTFEGSRAIAGSKAESG
jgi:ATP-dependent Clp protease ATP-binding subunit ClpB